MTARPPSEHLSSFASNLGRSFSNEKHPERRLEAIGPDGRPVVLLPMIYPMDFHIGFRTISFAHPGNWPVRPDAPSSGVIQLCMWRTRTHLSPGRYRMRLLPPRDDSDWVWDATGGVHGDFEWRELDLVRVRSLD